MSAVILPAPAALPHPRVTLSVDARGDALVRVADTASAAGHAPTSYVRVSDSANRRLDGTLYVSAPPIDSSTTFRLKAPSRDARVRVERLILAGT